jgi:hypothetical protein
VSNAQNQWRSEILGSAIDFANLTADFHRRKPDEETEPTLELVVFTLVSWWIDQGFSKQQIATALLAASNSSELELEGWLSRIKPDA